MRQAILTAPKHIEFKEVPAPKAEDLNEHQILVNIKRIGICGSGEGMSMTLNKHKGVRAALVWTPEISQLVRQHNDANVLVMPGRFIDNKTAEKIMDEFFRTPFEGGRHAKRVEMIDL